MRTCTRTRDPRCSASTRSAPASSSPSTPRAAPVRPGRGGACPRPYLCRPAYLRAGNARCALQGSYQPLLLLLAPPPPPRCCLAGGRRLLLSGVGATPEGYKPFLDTLDLTSRKTERLWKVRDKPGGERTRGVSSVQSDARVEATAAGSPFFKFVSFFGRGFGRPCSARRASSSESGL